MLAFPAVAIRDRFLTHFTRDGTKRELAQGRQVSRSESAPVPGLIPGNWFMLLCAVLVFIEIRAAVIRREGRKLQVRFAASCDWCDVAPTPAAIGGSP